MDLREHALTGIEDEPVSEAHVSPDGRWRWDGGQWVPNASASPPPPPGHPQAGYPLQYPYAYPGFRPQSTNGLSIASLVLGILWLWWVGSALALIFGYVSLSQIKQRNESGRGMAIAGIVLGWIGVGTFVFFVVVLAAAGSDSPAGF
jgi:hypothetical protein